MHEWGGVITVTLSSNLEVLHNVYVTQYKDGVVKLYGDQSFIDRLNEKLDDVEAVDKWCLKQYKEYIFSVFYRGNVFSIWDRTFVNKFKMAIKILMGRLKTSDIYMFHNINNEANYWVTRRALSMIMKDAM